MAGSENPFYREQQKQQARASTAQDQQDTGCQCPSCGNAVRPTADICEHCGQWLKDGQCCFCYTEVRAGQKFCRECGNPPLGITCPSCNTFSHFDFCPTCNTAVSKRAAPYLEAMKQSPLFAELFALSRKAGEVSSEAVNKETSSVDQLNSLKAYLQQFDQSTDVKNQTPGFTFQNNNIDASEALEKAAKQENIIQKQDTSAADLELMKKIALLQQQTFTDNQSARMFYTAIKVMIPELVKTKEKRLTGWLCNFAGVIHAAPHECSEPNLGGEWQFETYTTYGTAYSEH